MKTLVSEYGSMILSIIGVIMFFSAVAFVVNYFQDFSTEFIASLTGSQ